MKASFVLYSSANSDINHLIRRINWIRASGRYVLKDPSNKSLLLYLEEKQYTKLLDVSLSNDIHLEVIATPDDTEASVLARFNTDTSAPSGTPNFDNWVSKRSQLFSIADGWDISQSMINFERNFELFFPLYYRDVGSWLGLSYTAYGYKMINLYQAFMSRIKTYRGMNQVILLMKIQSIVVLQYIAGTRLKSTQELGQRIRLVNGLPKSLPVYFRNFIRNNDFKRIRIILTLLHAYKGFEGKYGKPDLSSIEAPRFDGLNDALNLELNLNIGPFWRNFNPAGIQPELIAHMDKVPFPLSAGPNHSVSFLGSVWDALAIVFNDAANLVDYHNALLKHSKDTGEFSNPTSMVYPFMVTVANRFKTEIQQGKITWKMIRTSSFYKSLLIEGLDYPPSYLFERDIINTPNCPVGQKAINKFLLTTNDNLVITWDYVLEHIIPRLYAGKLSTKLEAAGKIRVFAISDFFTQWIMKPLHNSLFNVLREHPCDATFDQITRVEQFQRRNYSFVASYDLKSATDLIPIQLYERVLQVWIGKETSLAWSRCLTSRVYLRKYNSREGPALSRHIYSRGQPMGTLSSWASLAMVHHFLVYLAAARVGIYNFRDYLVLGDDIVIAHKEVALSYTKVCHSYGITIGFAKSFVSHNGMFQFASQDIIGDKNISPISLKEVLTISAFSHYFGPAYNAAKTIEFLVRLTRKGFIDTNPVSILRASSNYSQWTRYSNLLTKGIFPLEGMKLLIGLLSRNLDLLNNVSWDQLIASIRGDIRLFTNNINYSDTDRIKFQRLIEVLVMKQIAATINRILSRDVDNKPILGSSTLRDLFHRSTFALKYERATSLQDINRVFNKFQFVIKGEHQLTPMEYLLKFGEDSAKPAKDLARLGHLLRMKGSLDRLLVRIELTKSVANTFDIKAPYLVRFYLSLLSEQERTEGKSQTWV